MKRLRLLPFCMLWPLFMQGQSDNASQKDTVGTDKPAFQQQPGLALAASKIFFSEKPWSISGFGEYNYVPMQQHVNTQVGDLELYYSGLYRQAVFFGYRITDKLIWNSEFQIEFLHYKNQESNHEIVVEAFVDYLFRDYLKVRFGFYPLTIGYVNNNDEPVMFYSVNRSEVERLIVPTTWIELGAMFYGSLSKDLSYALGLSQGLNSKHFKSGSWIRQGREIRIDKPETIAINPQINYTGIPNLTLSASGYYGQSGQGQILPDDPEREKIKGKIRLTTAYAKYDWKNVRLITVGAYGKLGDTEKIWSLTKDEQGQHGEVLGKEVYGYLMEAGWNIWPYIKKNQKEKPSKKTFFYDTQDLRLSLFARYERLNTHHGLHPAIYSIPRVENNMHILTLGLNFNTRENIVVKANYQYRRNKSPFERNPFNNIIETGMGFIF